MRQYSSDRVELSWMGLDFKEGVAQGTWITEAKTSPRTSKKPTGNGRVVRVFNPDRSGTLSIVVDQESKLHQQLQFWLLQDDLNRNVVSPMVMYDSTSGETFVYQNAYIEDDPNESRGTESTTFTWVFAFERKVKAPVTNLGNVVGS